MGVSGTAIFANDVACDIRDEYRELIEDGIDDAEAMRRTLEKYSQCFDDPMDGTAAIVGFALAQSKIGRLDPTIRDRAVAVIDQGGDLAIWEEESPKDVGKRKAALDKARAQLIGPQPSRKRLRPPKRHLCDLAPGDVLALDLPGGPLLLRTLRVSSSRYGETPWLGVLEFSGSEVPPAEVIRHLPGKTQTIYEGRSAFHHNFTAMLDAGDAGWKEAGFRKVANIPTSEDDEALCGPYTGWGIFWSALAREYRQRERHSI